MNPKLAELNWFRKVEIGPEVIDSKHFCIFVEAAKEVELNFRVASTEGCSDLRTAWIFLFVVNYLSMSYLRLRAMICGNV